MAKVQGIYTLRAQLYNKATTLADGGGILYEFTNNNRYADIGSAYPCDLNFVQLDTLSADSYNSNRRFIRKNKLMIKRVRVVTPGAPKLQPSPGQYAADFILDSYATDSGGSETSGNGLRIKLDFFNEWQDLNLWFENFNIDSADDTYKFKLVATRWVLNVDDYNLQAAYKNEPLYAFLELEVDTPGLMCNNRLV